MGTTENGNDFMGMGCQKKNLRSSLDDLFANRFTSAGVSVTTAVFQGDGRLRSIAQQRANLT